ncbi:hypothetical protein KAX35_05805 [candidate division WOR-3 bacterium]|nr:hypothetical protein [candidate division WOR-3 bacterium]
MRGKIALVMIMGVLLILTSSVSAADVSVGGRVCYWNFMWRNSDFKSENDSLDFDTYHALSLWADVKAEFEHGITAFIRPGSFGNFGNPQLSTSVSGDPTPAWFHVYLDVAEMFGSPISLRVGKQPVLYGDGLVAWDGGAEGRTGIKVSINTNIMNADIFAYRLIEGGGFIHPPATIDKDENIMGAYLTTHIMGGYTDISAYFFNRTYFNDKPIWVGVRTTGYFIPYLGHKLEFVKMMGSNGDDFDYNGKAFIAQLKYTIPSILLTFGGAYVSFSGDTIYGGENEYHNALMGPYVFDDNFNSYFGFGPAYNQLMTYNLCTDPSNLDVINAHVLYYAKPLVLRADYFMYSFNKVVGDVEKSIGNEIVLTLIYKYMETIAFGFCGGYFMPSDGLKIIPGKDGGDAGMACQIFTSLGFD